MLRSGRLSPLVVSIFLLVFTVVCPAAENTSSLETLPSLIGNGGGKKNENICPVCGKLRTECVDLFVRSQKDPSLKPKVCPIHYPEFTNGKTRPFNCPVCGHLVNVPQEHQHYEHADTDLCPHPKGKIRFISDIVICPNSGYAAFEKDFLEYTPPQNIKDFVKRNISPGMERSLRLRLGPEAKVDHKGLMKLFANQKEIPDTLRCMNAYSIYLERSKVNKDVHPLKLAHAAWLAAWAFRRDVCSSIDSGPLMAPLRRISSIMRKEGLSDDDMEANVQMLTRLYADKDRFDVAELQIIGLYQAGYYNRLGLNQWAMQILDMVKRECQKKYRTAEADPWLRVKAFSGIPPEKKMEIINNAKKFLVNLATQRMNSLQQENRFLGYASEILQKALAQGQCEPLTIPSYVYMVGEFERRRENHHKALLWLSGASQMLGEVVGVEHYAPQQIDLLRRYVTDRKITPKPDQKSKNDWALIQKLAVKAKAAQKQRKAKAASENTGK